MSKLPGGEYASAWASLAAATPKRREPRGEYARYTTAELVRDMSSARCDDATRAKMEAEVARRMAKGRKR